MASIYCLICKNVGEATWVEAAVHRVFELENGLTIPYETPVHPQDRHGPAKSKKTHVQRLTLPRTLADGTIAYACTATVQRLLDASSKYSASDFKLAPPLDARLQELIATKRLVDESEVVSTGG